MGNKNLASLTRAGNVNAVQELIAQQQLTTKDIDEQDWVSFKL